MRLKSITLKNFRCFEHLEVELHPRLTVFVGENGAGKSTLMKIIAGLDKNFQGEVVFSPGYTVGYLEQEPSFPDQTTLYEVFSSVFEELDRQEARMRELEHLIADSEGEEQAALLEEYDELIGRLYGPRHFRPFTVPTTAV